MREKLPVEGPAVRVRRGESEHPSDGQTGVVRSVRPNGLYEVWLDEPRYFADGEKLLGVFRQAEDLEPA